MKNLYVFLDIDGVLNNKQAFQKNRDTMFVLSDENLKVYQYLIDQLRQYYKVIIILSSTWRMSEIGMQKLSQKAIEYPALKIDKKIPDSFECRQDEILKYVNDHYMNKEEILIIDDASIDNELSNRHIKTDFIDGLTLKDIDCLDKFFKS